MLIESLSLWLAQTNCWIVAPAGPGGECVLVDAPPEPFLLVLALVLLFYLNLERLGRGESATVQRLRAPLGLVFAFLAGVFEAIANVAGPVLFVYFMLLGAAPSQVVQTLNMCFTVGKGSQVATLAGAGAHSFCAEDPDMSKFVPIPCYQDRHQDACRG